MEYHSRKIYQIALTKVPGVGDIIARNLLRIFPDETHLFTESKNALLAAGISPRIVAGLKQSNILDEAKKEAEFIDKNNLSALFITDKEYPKRLTDCVDAPILLYYKGKTDLNAQKIVSIVGTRNATDYATDFCDKFLQGLGSIYPDILIVSGLAYGVDIHAHRSALKYGLNTVGVLAHGLDRIYPATHRKTAVEMVQNGGLLTEFPSGTNPDKFNFVRRNRVVAGIADAVIVMESGEKGGSLITAEIACSYYRDVFALPGRVTDIHSTGCNNLIANNKAVLLQSAESFLKQMNWINSFTDKVSNLPKQRELFIQLNDDEQIIYDALSKEEMQVNMLAIQTNVPLPKLFYILLDLEMKGIVKPLPGGVYRLV